MLKCSVTVQSLCTPLTDDGSVGKSQEGEGEDSLHDAGCVGCCLLDEHRLCDAIQGVTDSLYMAALLIYRPNNTLEPLLMAISVFVT